MMLTETFKNDYRVIAKPTSFSSIPFPAMSIYQSDTTSPSQTAYMSQYRTHQRIHQQVHSPLHQNVPSSWYSQRWLQMHLPRFLHLQLPRSLRTGDREKAYETPLITHWQLHSLPYQSTLPSTLSCTLTATSSPTITKYTYDYETSSANKSLSLEMTTKLQ